MTAVAICCLHGVFSPFKTKIQRFLEMFPLLSKNCRKAGNIRTETEIVNPCIVVSKAAIGLWHLALRNLSLGLLCLVFLQLEYDRGIDNAGRQVNWQRQLLLIKWALTWSFCTEKNNSLTLLCINASIQPHFDYTYSAWFPHLTRKRKDSLSIW